MEPLLSLFLKRLDSTIGRKIKVVAVGGNVVVTLGLRDETIDLDIVVSKSDAKIVKKICEGILKDYETPSHVIINGDFYSFDIPDYWQRSMSFDSGCKNVDLRLLNLNDIILTKLNRSLPQDLADIDAIVTGFKIDIKDLHERFNLYFSTFRGGRKQKEEYLKNFQSFVQKYGLTKR